MEYEVSITAAQKPKNSLVLTIGVQQGYNQIRRNTGNYSASYLSEKGIINNTVYLEAEDTFDGIATNLLFVKCDQPLSVAYTRASDSAVVTVQVTNLFLLDEPTTGFVITNPEGGKEAQLFLHYSIPTPVTP